MLQYELVVRHILIERPDQVIAVFVSMPKRVIKFVTAGFRIANEIHPVSCPAFAEMFRCQQAINDFFESIV